MVLFRPEFLWAAAPAAQAPTPIDGLDGLPTAWVLGSDSAPVIAHAIAQMHQDTQTHAASLHAHALLRYQLYALLTRLRMAHEQQSAQPAPPGRALQRFKAFELLVEKHFAAWHQLPRYAQQLGCSEKSLVRASLEAAGVTPKAFISVRIVLEARRLLAHTTWPVARIAESLGYSDLANFAKFFKREAGCTPTEFRSRQADKSKVTAERVEVAGLHSPPLRSPN
jgi:AraC-like DNA-binding protein